MEKIDIIKAKLEKDFPVSFYPFSNGTNHIFFLGKVSIKDFKEILNTLKPISNELAFSFAGGTNTVRIYAGHSSDSRTVVLTGCRRHYDNTPLLGTYLHLFKTEKTK